MQIKKFPPNIAEYGKTFLELLIVILWALWVGRAYLDMNTSMWPSDGQEYIMSIQNNFNWPMLLRCGSCFFWNGFSNGGAPAFVDVHGAWLHPISIISTFLMGAINSGKGIVLASLVMAGLAQLWLGNIFKLSRASRVWTAMLVVASGALSGRMQIGNVPLVLSTAACILVFPAAISLVQRGGLKNTILFGLILGLAILSGQGYLQIGLAICLIPLLIFLLLGKKPEGEFFVKPNYKLFIYGAILALFIAAPLWVPLAHVFPIFNKDADPSFGSSQPINFNVLNLVINDAGFYQNTSLGKMPYPYLYINYIGWIPVILALWGLAHAKNLSRKLIVGIAATITIIFLTSSAELFKWLSIFSSNKSFDWIRNPTTIQSLAVPLIMVLAGIGIDHVLRRKWPEVSMATTQQNKVVFNINTNLVKRLIVLFVMGFSLKSVSDFSSQWLYVTEVPRADFMAIQALKTTDSQWVQPPFGEYAWFVPAVENDIKIREYFRPWNIARPQLPRAYLEMSRVQGDAALPEFYQNLGDYVILKRPDSLYAYILIGDQKTACQAKALGGQIDVQCDSAADGTLFVLEKAFSGWTVTLDGQSAALESPDWLQVVAPAGKHTYAFRYRPWDVPLGIGLAVIGWAAALAGFIYIYREEKKSKGAIAAEVKAGSPEQVDTEKA